MLVVIRVGRAGLVPFGGTWIWLRESTICVDFGLVSYSGLIMLCYHDYVVQSWIGYVSMNYDKLFDYVMLS